LFRWSNGERFGSDAKQFSLLQDSIDKQIEITSLAKIGQFMDGFPIIVDKLIGKNHRSFCQIYVVRRDIEVSLYYGLDADRKVSGNRVRSFNLYLID